MATPSLIWDLSVLSKVAKALGFCTKTRLLAVVCAYIPERTVISPVSWWPPSPFGRWVLPAKMAIACCSHVCSNRWRSGETFECPHLPGGLWFQIWSNRTICAMWVMFCLNTCSSCHRCFISSDKISQEQPANRLSSQMMPNATKLPMKCH